MGDELHGIAGSLRNPLGLAWCQDDHGGRALFGRRARQGLLNSDKLRIPEIVALGVRLRLATSTLPMISNHAEGTFGRPLPPLLWEATAPVKLTHQALSLNQIMGRS